MSLQNNFPGYVDLSLDSDDEVHILEPADVPPKRSGRFKVAAREQYVPDAEEDYARKRVRFDEEDEADAPNVLWVESKAEDESDDETRDETGDETGAKWDIDTAEMNVAELRHPKTYADRMYWLENARTAAKEIAKGRYDDLKPAEPTEMFTVKIADPPLHYHAVLFAVKKYFITGPAFGAVNFDPYKLFTAEFAGDLKTRSTLPVYGAIINWVVTQLVLARCTPHFLMQAAYFTRFHPSRVVEIWTEPDLPTLRSQLAAGAAMVTTPLQLVTTQLFQVLHALYAGAELVGFKHNNLRAQNVVLGVANPAVETPEYAINDKVFQIPNCPYTAMLKNFDVSTCTAVFPSDATLRGLPNARPDGLSFELYDAWDIFADVDSILRDTEADKDARGAVAWGLQKMQDTKLTLQQLVIACGKQWGFKKLGAKTPSVIRYQLSRVELCKMAADVPSALPGLIHRFFKCETGNLVPVSLEN